MALWESVVRASVTYKYEGKGFRKSSFKTRLVAHQGGLSFQNAYQCICIHVQVFIFQACLLVFDLSPAQAEAASAVPSQLILHLVVKGVRL